MNYLIVDYALTNVASDNNELSYLVMSDKETLGAGRLDVVADAGFNDSLEIKACVDKGITPYVAYRKQNAGAGGEVFRLLGSLRISSFMMSALMFMFVRRGNGLSFCR